MADESVTDLTRGVYRRIYAGYIFGQRINRLSLSAEAWFWRVYLAADDFGNFRADPELCKAGTAGLRKVTAKQVSSWLREMRDVGLIEFYTGKAGEPLLHILDFVETQPAGKNGKRIKKFPLPGESSAIQVNPVSSSATHNHNHNHNQDQNENDNQTDLSRSRAAQVRCVFEFWQEHLNHPKSALDSKRERVITQRLKDGYSVDDLKTAIRGLRLTPYNMGQNDRRQVYDDIELICRDAAHVDRFIQTAKQSESRPQAKTETIREKLLRESCEDCHGTGTKVIRGKGAIRCEHSNAGIGPSSDGVTSSSENR